MSRPRRRRPKPSRSALLLWALLVSCWVAALAWAQEPHPQQPTQAPRALQLLPPRAQGQAWNPGLGDLDTPLGPVLTPPERPSLPEDHTPAFRRQTHALHARLDADACKTCHTPQSCLDCHLGPGRVAHIHPPGYVSYHALDALKDAGSCQGCHNAQQFCLDCHSLARAGQGPAAPAPGVQFHPQGWVNGPGSPNKHGDEARRNLVACASCHREQDCVTCHSAINPHPPRFAASCAQRLRANPDTCARCHLDLSALRGRCR